ncbi:GNAT family N-acetyltransferase [Oleiagrimonas sp. C23AA]|uniref:GNAT family N-acetyltransferase n=1 Tax=Oleiagrimonas sp. C23AA TaxID=2719047 RepID=UPI0014216618|nr:GNAT family N-acetyltransferase [Oleiagrimonas sp. C23AA]NII09854.1 GNAT family N-acetyltransferase [Oleiagrimonas sp. C23AA]
MQPRPIESADHAAILSLNARFVAVLSPMDGAHLAHLLAQPGWHRAIGPVGAPHAFVLVLREGADYASANYRWFADRYARFAYIDRVVVAPEARRAGHAAALYAGAFTWARKDVSVIGCEYDIAPPNPASAAFHAAMDFVEVGRQHLPGGKQVALQARQP